MLEARWRTLVFLSNGFVDFLVLIKNEQKKKKMRGTERKSGLVLTLHKLDNSLSKIYMQIIQCNNWFQCIIWFDLETMNYSSLKATSVVSWHFAPLYSFSILEINEFRVQLNVLLLFSIRGSNIERNFTQ